MLRNIVFTFFLWNIFGRVFNGLFSFIYLFIWLLSFSYPLFIYLAEYILIYFCCMGKSILDIQHVWQKKKVDNIVG